MKAPFRREFSLRSVVRATSLPLVLGMFAAPFAVASCSKCGERPDETTLAARGGGAEEAVAPAPEGLLSDLVIATPNASWGKLQRGIGGAVGILPASAGGIIATAAGLDPFLASEIDGAAPAYGALAGDPASPGYVIALKLNDLRKARAGLVDGDTARFDARESGGITELVAKGKGEGPPVALGISPNGYLLIARRSEDLARLTAYATRTLPKRPLPAEGAVVLEVPRAALGLLVKPKLEALWSSAKAYLLTEDERMRRERGRAPDYGDPKAIVAAVDGWITRRIAVLGDLDAMRLALDVGDEGISMVTTMTPAAGGGPASVWTEAMTTGDAAPVANLPASSAVGLLLRDTEEERAEQGRELEKIVTGALGPRLAEGDAKKLHGVVEDWNKGRSDLLTVALAWDEPQGLALRAQVRDGEAAGRAVRGALELVRAAPFKELLRTREVTTSSEDLSGVGKVSLATILREPARGREPVTRAPRIADAGAGASDAGAGKRTAKDTLGLAWVVEGGMLTLATGEAPTTTLGGAARPERKLGDEPQMARSFAGLANTTNSLLVVQPLRFIPARANLPPAPLVVALGRKEKKAVVQIDMAHGLLRELARRQMGL